MNEKKSKKVYPVEQLDDNTINKELLLNNELFKRKNKNYINKMLKRNSTCWELIFEVLISTHYHFNITTINIIIVMSWWKNCLQLAAVGECSVSFFIQWLRVWIPLDMAIFHTLQFLSPVYNSSKSSIYA